MNARLIYNFRRLENVGWPDVAHRVSLRVAVRNSVPEYLAGAPEGFTSQFICSPALDGPRHGDDFRCLDLIDGPLGVAALPGG